MTPKAPPDILRWVTNSTAANFSNSTLNTRNIVAGFNDEPLNGSLSYTPSKAAQLQSIEGLYVMALVEVAVPLFVLLLLYRFGFSGLWESLNGMDRYTKVLCGTEVFWNASKYIEARVGVGGTKIWRWIRIGVTATMVLWLSASLFFLAYIWRTLYLQESWSETSDFLDACKLRQVWRAEIPLQNEYQLTII